MAAPPPLIPGDQGPLIPPPSCCCRAPPPSLTAAFNWGGHNWSRRHAGGSPAPPRRPPLRPLPRGVPGPGAHPAPRDPPGGRPDAGGALPRARAGAGGGPVRAPQAREGDPAPRGHALRPRPRQRRPPAAPQREAGRPHPGHVLAGHLRPGAGAGLRAGAAAPGRGRGAVPRREAPAPRPPRAPGGGHRRLGQLRLHHGGQRAAALCCAADQLRVDGAGAVGPRALRVLLAGGAARLVPGAGHGGAGAGAGLALPQHPGLRGQLRRERRRRLPAQLPRGRGAVHRPVHQDPAGAAGGRLRAGGAAPDGDPQRPRRHRLRARGRHPAGAGGDGAGQPLGALRLGGLRQLGGQDGAGAGPGGRRPRRHHHPAQARLRAWLRRVLHVPLAGEQPPQPVVPRVLGGGLQLPPAPQRAPRRAPRRGPPPQVHRPGAHRARLALRAGGQGAVRHRRRAGHGPRAAQPHGRGLPGGGALPPHGPPRRPPPAAPHPPRGLQRQRGHPGALQRAGRRAGQLRPLPVPARQWQRPRGLPGRGALGAGPAPAAPRHALARRPLLAAALGLQRPVRAGRAQEAGEGRAVLLALRALLRLPLPRRRAHLPALRPPPAPHARPLRLPPHAPRPPALELAAGRPPPGAGRRRAGGHRLRAGHLRPAPRDARGEGGGARAELRAAGRHRPRLRHHLPHGGRAGARRLRPAAPLPGAGHEPHLRRAAHQDQPHLPHLRAGEALGDPPAVHQPRVPAGHHLRAERAAAAGGGRVAGAAAAARGAGLRGGAGGRPRAGAGRAALRHGRGRHAGLPGLRAGADAHLHRLRRQGARRPRGLQRGQAHRLRHVHHLRRLARLRAHLLRGRPVRREGVRADGYADGVHEPLGLGAAGAAVRPQGVRHPAAPRAQPAPPPRPPGAPPVGAAP